MADTTQESCNARQAEIKAAIKTYSTALKAMRTEMQAKSTALKTALEVIENKYKDTCPMRGANWGQIRSELMRETGPMSFDTFQQGLLHWIEQMQRKYETTGTIRTEPITPSMPLTGRATRTNPGKKYWGE